MGEKPLHIEPFVVVTDREPRPSGIAYIFPGQGIQIKGMGRDLYDRYGAARKVFRQADDVLGFSLSTVCFDDPKEELGKTDVAQMAIGTVCIAAYEAAKETYPNLTAVVGGGVSFGELPNLVAAGVIDFPAFLKLIKERGNIMEDAGRKNPGRMVMVMGLDREVVEDICTQSDVYPAIYYPGERGVINIAGGLEEMERAVELCTDKKARVRPVTNYAFHTPLMGGARDEIKKVLDFMEFRDPNYPIVLNANGQATRSGEEIKRLLPEQLTNPVDTPKTIATMGTFGAYTFIEFSPQPFFSKILVRSGEELQAVTVHNAQSMQDLALLLPQSLAEMPS